MSRESYSSRVSLNQSVIMDKTSQIMRIVHRESILIGKLKDSQKTSDEIDKKLNKVIMQT